MQDTNITERNSILAEKVIKGLNQRNFEAYFCQNKAVLKEKISEIISKEETVSWGGSMTLEETAIKKYLYENNYQIIDRDKAKTKEEKRELIIKGLCGDVFLMSANAITEDGQLVNIDGNGNRIAALCYGPKKVIVIAGMNKIVKTLDDAISRARNFAAPVNAKRVSKIFEMNTPCLINGSCADCKSETSICSQIHITRLSNPKGRIKVILVNENLGY